MDITRLIKCCQQQGSSATVQVHCCDYKDKLDTVGGVYHVSIAALQWFIYCIHINYPCSAPVFNGMSMIYTPQISKTNVLQKNNFFIFSCDFMESIWMSCKILYFRLKGRWLIHTGTNEWAKWIYNTIYNKSVLIVRSPAAAAFHMSFRPEWLRLEM